MKAIFRVLVLGALAAAAAFTVIGCGSDKKGTDPNAYYGYNGYNPYGGFNGLTGPALNPNTVILSGNLQLADGASWKKALRSIGACNDQVISTCHFIDGGSPRITVVLNDYTFAQNATTTGSVTIGGAQIEGRPFMVNWYKVNVDGSGSSNAGFDTQVLGSYTDSGRLFAAPSQTPMRILNTGRPTDSSVLTQFYYGNTLIAQGRLARMNR